MFVCWYYLVFLQDCNWSSFTGGEKQRKIKQRKWRSDWYLWQRWDRWRRRSGWRTKWGRRRVWRDSSSATESLHATGCGGTITSTAFTGMIFNKVWPDTFLGRIQDIRLIIHARYPNHYFWLVGSGAWLIFSLTIMIFLSLFNPYTCLFKDRREVIDNNTLTNKLTLNTEYKTLLTLHYGVYRQKKVGLDYLQAYLSFWIVKLGVQLTVFVYLSYFYNAKFSLFLCNLTSTNLSCHLYFSEYISLSEISQSFLWTILNLNSI